MEESLKPGTQIIYIPMHAKGDENHPDVEEGFVTTHRPGSDAVYCRYWSKHYPGELRTKASSDLTPRWFIREKVTHDQDAVDRLVWEIFTENGWELEA